MNGSLRFFSVLYTYTVSFLTGSFKGICLTELNNFMAFLASVVISQLSWKWDSIDIKGRTRETSPSLFPVGVLAGIKQKRCVAFLNKHEEVLVWNVKYKDHIMKEKTFTYIEQGKVSVSTK